MMRGSVTLDLLAGMATLGGSFLNRLERALGTYYSNSAFVGAAAKFSSRAGSVFAAASAHSASLSAAVNFLALLKNAIFNFAGNIYRGSGIMNALGRAAENSRWII
ncbi:MAG: hypothetical protein JW919_00635 [Candidatus Omnitrophica bacterium]|nr:hypothetical protein [Candidatus Omnitrophota bacterium]